MGVFLLNEYVARKGLGATRWHVLALLLVPGLFQTVAVIWNPATRLRAFARQPFRLLGIPSRLLLLLFLLPLFQGPTALAAILAACVAAEVLLIPLQNTIVAANYSDTRRGRLFGMATAVQAATIVVVGVPAGWLLDRVPNAWPWLYALAAAGGTWGYWHWSRLRRRWRPATPTGLPVHRSPWQALRHDRPFLAFEACFMVYGLGFLMLLPTLPMYLVDEVGVTYGQIGIARGALFWLTMVIAGPAFGWLSDRIGILRTGALAFLILSGFPVLMLVLPDVAGLYAGFTVFGFAMAGVHLAWNLGPISLARGRDPLPYLEAHVALVGVRALVGMAAGTWIQLVLGSRAVFVTVIVLEACAAVGMYLTARLASRRMRDV